MATATYDATENSDVVNIWRTIQTSVHQGFQFMSEEWEQLDFLKRFKVDVSLRSITVPIDITEDFGIASIAEGAFEARPSSPNVQELSLSIILLNGRFTVSKTAHWVEQHSAGAMIAKQMKYQAGKKIQAMGRKYADLFYGLSDGVVALVETDPGGAATTVTAMKIDDGYGQSSYDNTDWLMAKFKVNEYIALIRSAALVSDAIGRITAIDTTNRDIDVAWGGSADPADNDSIVKAESLGNTAIGDTDFNKGLVGLTEMATATSVHSLSGVTYPAWTAAVNNSDGGRLTTVKLMSDKQAIANSGGGTADTLWVAQGVVRDMVALHQAGSRFGSPLSMEMDGSVKFGNLNFFSSQRVPPGTSFMADRKSIRKISLLPSKPDAPMWDDGHKIPDKSAFIFPIDFPCATVCLNRGNIAHRNGLTEQ